jgi:uncharacterized protein involved in exopolysaccharide biosynthesis
MRQLAAPASDGIEIADVARTVRGQWRAVIGFLLAGVLTALGVLAFAPRLYEGKALLLARPNSSESGGSILGRLSNVGDLMRGGGLGGLTSPFESELQVLRSRAIAGRIVDSLQLQFLVRDPRGVPALQFIVDSDLPGRFAPRRYRFERTPKGYRVQRDGRWYDLVPGTPSRLDVGSVTLAATGLPASFSMKVIDREDAITRLSKKFTANKAGGDVAKITYRGEDPITAAAVPNLVIAYYLDRRKTVDRGVNVKRVDYITAQLEATGAELAATERALRQHQVASGVLDAEIVGKAELDGAVALRESLTVVQVEESALMQTLAQVANGTSSARNLASYPAFMRGSSISPLIAQITEAEAAKVRLLERRTEKDPEVMVLDQNIQALEVQILGFARSYASGITKHRIGLQAQVDTLQRRMLSLPVAAERGGRMQRDIIRLTAIYTALQAQLVEARLAAIGEGGDIRSIDDAAVPRKPWFPEPYSTLGIGTLGGLVAGMIAALFLGWFGRWFRDPVEIERATGIMVQQFASDAPLLVAGSGRTVLVVPLAPGAQAGAVAQRLAHTATTRSLATKVLDLSNGNGTETGHSAALIDKLEAENGMLVVQLPDLAHESTVAALRENRPVLLVAPPGRVDRVQLSSALDLLQRAGVPCAGVVLSENERRGIRA